ncbi:MAG: porin family protein [Holosporaceae bacterium]|jgi:opacity protein-like surface antigen|nr:porin family protein [Holosporaceae bacterium]
MKKIMLAAALGSFVLSVGAGEVIVAEESSDGVVDSFCGAYFGLGLGGSFLKNKFEKMDSQNINRFIGTIVLGAGKTFNSKFYIGGEALIDFTKSKTNDIKVNGVKQNISIRNRGITPELALRFGFVRADWLFYFKPAVVFQKVSTKSNNIEMDTSKVAYSVALGLEKTFCRKFSARLEGEYVFKTKVEKAKVGKAEFNEGFNLRALVAYNVKI